MKDCDRTFCVNKQLLYTCYTIV